MYHRKDENAFSMPRADFPCDVCDLQMGPVIIDPVIHFLDTHPDHPEIFAVISGVLRILGAAAGASSSAGFTRPFPSATSASAAKKAAKSAIVDQLIDDVRVDMGMDEVLAMGGEEVEVLEEHLEEEIEFETDQDDGPGKSFTLLVGTTVRVTYASCPYWHELDLARASLVSTQIRSQSRTAPSLK